MFLKLLRFLWISAFCLSGSMIGAIVVGQLDSIVMTVLGALGGFVIGASLGRFVPWFEWFSL